MKFLASIFAVVAVMGLTGCADETVVSNEHLKEAIKWTKDYPTELTPQFKQNIQDDRLTTVEWNSLREKHRVLENAKLMGTVRSELDTIAQADLEIKIAELQKQRDGIKVRPASMSNEAPKPANLEAEVVKPAEKVVVDGVPLTTDR